MSSILKLLSYVKYFVVFSYVKFLTCQEHNSYVKYLHLADI